MRRRWALAVAILSASLLPVPPAQALGSPPYAVATWACEGNATCLFDGSASWDPEETPLAFAWRVIDPDPSCAQTSGAGQTAWLCIGPTPREVELWVADQEGLTGRWNATVSAQGIHLAVRPNPCQGLRCDFAIDVTTANPAQVVINVTGQEEPICWPDSAYGDDGGWPECWHHALLPGNGTYEVRLRADDFLGNVTETVFAVTVANRPPLLTVWLDCRDGSLRCGAWAYAYDEDDWNWSLNVTWELEPGVFVQGSEVEWLFSRPGIHRVRARTEDAHGWAVTEVEIVSLRNHAWTRRAGLPPGTPAALASDGGTLYALDGPPSGSLSTRVQSIVPSSPESTLRSVNTLNLRVRDAAFGATWAELHVLGGDDGAGPKDYHQILDRGTEKWRAGPSLPTPLSGAAAVYDFNDLWLLGGASTSGPSGATWRLAEGVWIPGPDLPWNGTTHAAVLHGSVYVAGEVDGVPAVYRHRPAGELLEGWDPMPQPPGGLGPIRGMAGFDGRLWVVEEGADWTVRGLDVYPLFGGEPSWDAPIRAPEPLGAVAWGWEGLWATGRDVGKDGTRALHIFGPTRVPFVLRLALPAIVHESEGGRLLASASAPAGEEFEELLALTLHGGPGLAWPQQHIPLAPGAETAVHALPPLGPGRYRAHVHAYATGTSLNAPFEVVTVWS